MKILKRENWWAWLLLLLFSQSSSTFVLAALLDCYDKKAWYANVKYWLLGLVCFIFPFFIMLSVFAIQMTAQVAAKLDVPGKELYLSPYVWLLCLIIPIIGWVMFTVMALYLQIWIIVMLYRGSGEKFIEN